MSPTERPPVEAVFDADALPALLRRPPPRGLHRRALVARQRSLALYARLLQRMLEGFERRSARRPVTCPLCGWEGLRFRPYVGAGWVRRNNTCPACGSQERHRLLWRLGADELGVAGPLLHIAPEACLRSVVAGALTTDLDMADVDFRSDVSRLPMADATVAAAVCSDVLEHVADDVAALRELRRVLVVGGRVVVHVPVLCTETVEYGRAVVGDNGHRRAYGPDIVDRFTAAGLDVDWRLAGSLPGNERRRLGLYDEDVLFIGRRVD